MATAVAPAVDLPVTGAKQQPVGDGAEAPAEQEPFHFVPGRKPLIFEDKPWASTTRVNVLTGTQRDESIAQNITQLIGHTPLLELHSLTQSGAGRIVAKLESFNPQGSVKDRIALSMINDAEEQGIIAPDRTTILEITSGNTGIGLATVAIQKGYKVLCVMPAYYSIERRITLLALGAEIVVTKAEKGVPVSSMRQGAVEKLEELAATIPGAWIAGQFTNHANAKVHYETTGPEIWTQTGGKVDIFVAGAGTGGTISGVGRYLREQNPAIQIIGVEPAESSVISGKEAAPHRIQGLGPGFVPETLDTGVLDEVIPISADKGIHTAKQLALKEGVFVGISSGAAAAAAARVAARPENAGKLIAVLFPSYGERYLSTDLVKDYRHKAENLPHH